MEHTDKFIYAKDDIEFIDDKDNSIKEKEIIPFSQYIYEKNNFIKFNPDSMRWITIQGKDDKTYRIIVKKKNSSNEKINKKEELSKIRNFSNEDVKKLFKDVLTKQDEIHTTFDLKNNVKLNEKEIDAIQEYADIAYSKINRLLRKKNSSTDKDSYKESKSYILNISKALKKFKTPEPISVFRGIKESATKRLLENIEKGNTEFIDNGFCSTTTDSFIARDFSEGGYLLKIYVPKGTHAASIKSLSTYDEKEILIDKGSKFQVKYIDDENKIIYVRLKNN